MSLHCHSAPKVVIDAGARGYRVPGSLEEAFATLAAQNPEALARDIADIVTGRA